MENRICNARGIWQPVYLEARGKILLMQFILPQILIIKSKCTYLDGYASKEFSLK